MIVPDILPIAVIIAAYNAENTIKRAIISALSEGAQQVIVVDDASTDSTLYVLNEMAKFDARVIVLSQEYNQGPSAARNRAIKHVKTDWISILDADDYFANGRLQKLIDHSHNADLVADHRWSVLEEDASKFNTQPVAEKEEYVSFEDFIERNLTTKNATRQELGFIKPIIRFEFLKSLNLHYREDMRLGEDFELYAKALYLKARLLIIPFKGYVSVVRNNSLSGEHSINDLIKLRDCLFQLQSHSHYSNIVKDYKKVIYLHMNNTNCRVQWRLLINAFKEKNIIKSCKCFLNPFPVPYFLVCKLLEQIKKRHL